MALTHVESSRSFDDVFRRRAFDPGPLAVSAFAAVVLALGAGTVVLHLLNGTQPLTAWWFGTTTTAVTSGAMGALLVRTRPANPIGWLFCLAGLAAGACGLGREYLVRSVVAGPLPGAAWIGWLADSLYIAVMAALPAVLMLFPDGRTLGGRWRLVLAAVPVGGCLAWLGYAFAPDATVIAGQEIANPAGSLLPSGFVYRLNAFNSLSFVVLAACAIASLAVRYRRAAPRLRLQLTWVFFTGTVALVELALELLPSFAVGMWLGPLVESLFIASIAVAIVRHQLLDIELVVNRTLVYLVVSFLLLGLYLGAVALVARSVGGRSSGGASLLGTALVAVAFAPLRSRVQSGVDRLIYGDRKDPYGVMSSLTRQLEQADALGTELGIVLETITRSLRLPYAAITSVDGLVKEESGCPRGAVSVRPLTYRGTPVGDLEICPRAPGETLGAADERLLDDLGRQAGALLHVLRLAADLQESRRRLVTAKEEERRRLRRDLHDGLGPELAALTLKAEGAALQLGTRPERASELLSEVKGGLRHTIADVRRLVYDLRPPCLDELGLPGALRDFANRMERADARPLFRVDAPEERTAFPAAVEVAAYRIATEAMTNVVRHANASHCQVRLVVDPGDHLDVIVEDDGCGVGEDPVAGVGTRSMIERATEIGGTAALRRRTDGAGARVHARLPLGFGAGAP